MYWEGLEWQEAESFWGNGMLKALGSVLWMQMGKLVVSSSPEEWVHQLAEWQPSSSDPLILKSLGQSHPSHRSSPTVSSEQALTVALEDHSFVHVLHPSVQLVLPRLPCWLFATKPQL
jgi:hypothetical protein